MFRRFGIIPGDPAQEGFAETPPMEVLLNTDNIVQVWKGSDDLTRVAMLNGTVFISEIDYKFLADAMDLYVQKMH